MTAGWRRLGLPGILSAVGVIGVMTPALMAEGVAAGNADGFT